MLFYLLCFNILIIFTSNFIWILIKIDYLEDNSESFWEIVSEIVPCLFAPDKHKSIHPICWIFSARMNVYFYLFSILFWVNINEYFHLLKNNFLYMLKLKLSWFLYFIKETNLFLFTDFEYGGRYELVQSRIRFQRRSDTQQLYRDEKSRVSKIIWSKCSNFSLYIKIKYY